MIPICERGEGTEDRRGPERAAGGERETRKLRGSRESGEAASAPVGDRSS